MGAVVIMDRPKQTAFRLSKEELSLLDKIARQIEEASGLEGNRTVALKLAIREAAYARGLTEKAPKLS